MEMQGKDDEFGFVLIEFEVVVETELATQVYISGERFGLEIRV